MCGYTKDEPPFSFTAPVKVDYPYLDAYDIRAWRSLHISSYTEDPSRNWATGGSGAPVESITEQAVAQLITDPRYVGLDVYRAALLLGLGEADTPGFDDRQMAIRFRPRLFFDGSEKFRPLDVRTFVSERNAAGEPVHRLCNPVLPNDQSGAPCLPLTDVAQFADLLTRDAGSWVDTPSQDTASASYGADFSCFSHDLQDCDSVQPVGSTGMWSTTPSGPDFTTSTTGRSTATTTSSKSASATIGPIGKASLWLLR